jgi:hypothetical protein
MEHTIALHRPSIARASLPQELRDIESWPSVDSSLIKDKQSRARFLLFRDGVELWIAGAPLTECAARVNTSVRNFCHIVERCLALHHDGRIWGLRALVKGAQVVPRMRTKEFENVEHCALSAGFSGMFSKTLRQFPAITAELNDALVRKGKRALAPNKMLLREIHRVYVDACRLAGIKSTEYPFNTKEKGRRALRKWINTTFMEKYAIDYTRDAHGDSAANVMSHGTYEKGAVPDVPRYPVFRMAARRI